MWLLGALSPDVKTIADYLCGNDKIMRNVCRQFFVLCQALNPLTHAVVAIDGHPRWKRLIASQLKSLKPDQSVTSRIICTKNKWPSIFERKWYSTRCLKADNICS
ncbi:hypothetical protein [Vogesella indigofera]|uniref:hypothetical protein n=1 Tax=Vogesella indigofera TaxID=45465 RepID=UPI00234F4DE1|nr:hypothetical protein [Vogesella indigofera]MDC7701700.1 hypothetical protein [Vogesella indigofera]